MGRKSGARHNGQSSRSSAAAHAQLRRDYFAHAAEQAMRYDVSFDRLLEHLDGARADHPHLDLRAIRYVDDLVHTVACIDGVELAWWDLVDQHELGLVRACRQWLDDIDAIVFVRRLLARVRQDPERRPSLRSFDGTVSLRRWLGDRLVGGLNQCGAGFAGAPRPGLTWQPVIMRGDNPPVAQPLRGRLVEGEILWSDPPPAPRRQRPNWDRPTGASG